MSKTSVVSNFDYFLPGETNGSTNFQRHGLKDGSIVLRRIYEPREKDLLFGIVIVRTPDSFIVDINSSETAILPITSFLRGSLPDRQKMNRLSVVCARVFRTDRWVQPELTCLPSNSSKNVPLGLVDDGTILRCSLILCEKLQNSSLINRLCQMINGLEIRVGRNGFIWYRNDKNDSSSIIPLKNILYEHEFENNIDLLIQHYRQAIEQLKEREQQVKQSNIQAQTAESSTDVH